MDVLMEQEQWRLNKGLGSCPRKDKIETISNISCSKNQAPKEHSNYHAEKDQGAIPALLFYQWYTQDI